MNLLDAIPAGAVVAVDTAPVIYFVEGHAVFGPVIRPLFVERFGRGITSVISLTEVLVKPLKTGRADLIQGHRDVLTALPNFRLHEIVAATAERAAHLRASLGLRLPDALQVAAALEGGATHFVTNDFGLRRVTDLQVLVLQDCLLPPVP